MIALHQDQTNMMAAFVSHTDFVKYTAYCTCTARSVHCTMLCQERCPPVFEGKLLADEQNGGDGIKSSQLSQDQKQARAIPSA